MLQNHNSQEAEKTQPLFIDSKEWNNFDKEKRATLFQSMLGLKPTFLISSYNENGDATAAIFNNILHLGAHPPLIAIQFRPADAYQQTFKNLLREKVLVLNSIHYSFYEDAHKTSYKKKGDATFFEGKSFSFMKAPLANFQAPVVKESGLVTGWQLKEIVDIEYNGTRLAIMEMDWLQVSAALLEDDFYLDPALGDRILSCGLDGYYEAKKIGRFPRKRPIV